MNINFRTLSYPVAYAVNAAIVFACLMLFKPGSAFLSIYWPLAFWTLVALDAYTVHKAGWTSEEKHPLADRFIGYIFAAPFIFPTRAMALVSSARGSR